MSLAQVELMCVDTSITVYPKTDRCKGGRGGKKEIEFGRMSKSSIDTARQRWERMKADKAAHRDRGFTEGYSAL